MRSRRSNKTSLEIHTCNKKSERPKELLVGIKKRLNQRNRIGWSFDKMTIKDIHYKTAVRDTNRITIE